MHVTAWHWSMLSLYVFTAISMDWTRGWDKLNSVTSLGDKLSIKKKPKSEVFGDFWAIYDYLKENCCCLFYFLSPGQTET